VDRWSREHAPENYTGASAYESDSSSSDGSIPNVRPLNSFTSYNSSAKKDRASLPAPPSSSADEHDSIAGVEIVRSDLPQPVPQLSGQMNADAHVSSATPPTSHRFNVVEGKRTMSAAAKERQSQIMRGNGASQMVL